MSDAQHHLAVETAAARALLETYRDCLGDDEQLVLDTLEGETRLFEAVDRVLVRLAELEDYMEAIVIHGRKLNDRNSRYRAQHEKLKTALRAALETAAVKKLERPCGTVSLRASPGAVEITDLAALPPQFLVQPPLPPPQPDKKALRAALKEGAVPGAILTTETTIQITRS
jgi:hypothetical protein